MKKKVIMFLISLSMIATAIPMEVYADDYEGDESEIVTQSTVDYTDYFTYSLSGSNCYVAGFSEYGNLHSNEDIVIPDTAYGYTVIGIDEGAFAGKTIGSLTMPTNSNFRYIRKHAFKSCDMDVLNIPKNVTSLGTEALIYFKGTKIIFGGGIRTIPKLNMWNCSNLTDIYFGDGTVTIDDNVCGYCPVERIYIGSTVSDIGSHAFHYATSNGNGNDPLRNVTIYTDNTYAKGLTYRLSYINPTFKSASGYVSETTVEQSIIFQKDAQQEIKFNVPLGTIKSVRASGVSLNYTYSNGKIIIPSSAVAVLPNGIYDIQVAYDDQANTIITNKFTLLVTGAENSGGGRRY